MKVSFVVFASLHPIVFEAFNITSLFCPLNFREENFTNMSKVGDYEAVRKDIVALLDQPEYDE